MKGARRADARPIRLGLGRARRRHNSWLPVPILASSPRDCYTCPGSRFSSITRRPQGMGRHRSGCAAVNVSAPRPCANAVMSCHATDTGSRLRAYVVTDRDTRKPSCEGLSPAPTLAVTNHRTRRAYPISAPDSDCADSRALRQPCPWSGQCVRSPAPGARSTPRSAPWPPGWRARSC